jgi:hypothetical protein
MTSIRSLNMPLQSFLKCANPKFKQVYWLFTIWPLYIYNLVSFSVSFIIVLKALTKVTSGNLFKHGTKRSWIIRNHLVTAKTTNLVAEAPTDLLWSGIRTVKIVMTRHEWVAIRLFKAHPSWKQASSPYYMKREYFSRSANRKLGSPTTSWTHENKRLT